MSQSKQRPLPAPPTSSARNCPQTLRADFDDVDDLCSAVQGWQLDFRPIAVDAVSGKVASIVQRRFGDLSLSYGRFRASIDQLGAPPAGALTFAVLGAGTRRLWWRGRDLDAGTVMVFPPGSELRSVSGPDFEVHTLAVPDDRVAYLAEHLQLPSPARHGWMETFRPAPDDLQALRLGLGNLDRREDDRVLHDARCIADNLVLAWLRAHDGRDVRAPLRRRDHAIRACLARLEHPDWPQLSPALLCEVGGVGERTLQYAFRERFGLTPAAFLKARRLAAVRRSLMNGAPGQSVVDVAARFGFWHTGQFAADYRRAFGEAPSATGPDPRG